MSNTINSQNPFGAHKDVLEAPIPSDTIGRTVLLTELKNRAKAAVGAGQWPDAQSLYDKAIAICDADDTMTSESAVCHANLSLVLGKMNQWAHAKQAAMTATQQDASYTKGYWRLGTACAALKDYEAALQAMEQVKAQEPTNRALLKEVERIRTEQQKHQQQAQPQPKAPASSTAAPPKTTPAPPRSELAKGSSAAAKPSSANDDTAPGDSMDTTTDDGGFTKSEITRGYKIVNGKKTSYFHNELDEHTKQLIGDIAPKKLEHADSTMSNESDTMGSAWNQAGTWEERDVSKWACESLQQALLAATYEIAPATLVTVTKATVTGSASVAMVRGKKRYIYELAATVQWKVGGDDDNATAHGSMTFPDIDGTCMVGEPYDVTDFKVESSSSSTSLDANVLHANVCKGGLREEFYKAIDGWVELLKETY